MNQLSFLDQSANSTKPINVASVPQRSPFRYPGGKTWLVPYIRLWLSKYEPDEIEFIEPFAGGAIISLTVAFEQLARSVTLIELDIDVISVWQTILSDDATWLANRILHFDLTDSSAEQELSRIPTSVRERAFQTILRNRINRGGILAPGAGRLKYGENGKGLLSRWYPKTLYKRIMEITKFQSTISCIHGNGLEYIESNHNQKNAIFFIDPPYTAGGKKAGSRLYTHYILDHDKLFSLVSQIKGDFLMTYDNAAEVNELAQSYGFDTCLVPMKNTHHSEMRELLIGRNLDWIKSKMVHR
jgi:DNA adenine methylase